MDDGMYTSMLEAVKHRYGYDFTGYTPASLKRRISRFMLSSGIPDLNGLTKALLSNDEMFESFVQSLSVTVTELFRDPLFFASLRDTVLPRLATYPLIKIWVAGCATGQEVLSVAIMLREATLLQRAIIYATDINQQSLVIARQGIYPAEELTKYDASYMAFGGVNKLSDYYVKSHGAALFDKTLIDKVIFSPHNLATDKSFNEFQLILCRNVLMYFDRSLQEKVVTLFSESLCTFGYIGLGDKETLHFSGQRRVFEEVDRRQKIYRKITP